ncbi:MAG: hypothetical protein ACP5R0_01090 [Thermoplasmata archaeon]
MGNELITKADKMYDRELFDQALNLYLEALKNADEIDKPYLLRRIAECYFYKDNSDTDKALQYEEELLKQKTGEDLLREKIFYVTILAEKDREKALNMLKEMLEDARSRNIKSIFPEIYNTMGLFQWGTDAAEKNFKSAMEEASKTKDLENYILALQNLAYMEAEKGNNLKALDYLKNAMDTIDDAMKGISKTKRKEFKESYADLYDQAANLAMDMEDFDLAMEIAQRGKKLD